MRAKTIFSHVVGKKFGPKQGEVTLAWICCIVKRSMIRSPGHSQVRRWYGHVARMGQDRNVYNSHSETCG
jgi:hypothetical protein